jgi:uncharacterized membrane protein YqjE
MQEHNNRNTVSSTAPSADLPLKELVGGLGRDMGLLVRQEIELAKAELSEQMSRVAKSGVSMGIAAFLAYAGLLTMVAALVLIVVALGVVAWLAAAVIGLVLLFAGYSTIQRGRQRLAEGKPTLQRTKETAKETVHRLKEQLQ